MSSVTVLGREVTIPVEVRHARSWFATFVLRREPVARLLAPTGLAPAPLPGGRAMASLAFVRYTDGDLDPYREVAVAFVVADPLGSRSKGAYIHRLPVDQEFTCAAGREIWGFPKFVTPIDITERTSAEGLGARHGRVRHRPANTEEVRADSCRLTVDGELALAMTVRPGLRAPMRSTALDAFSFRDGVLRRTKWELSGSGSRMRPGGVQVELGTGEIADELRGLGLPKRALMSGSVADVQMRFQAAEVLSGGAVTA
jgi:hypothetical protein